MELTTLSTFPGLGHTTLHAQPRLCSSRPPVRTRFYSILPRCNSYRTDVFMSHHIGTLMVIVVFNIHWDESPCTAVIKFPVPNILTLAAFSIWFQRKQTVMTFIFCSWRRSPEKKREGCCLSFIIWWWILHWGKAGQKIGKGQSNWGSPLNPSSLTFLPLWSPLQSPLCTYTVIWVSPPPLSYSTYV